MIPPTHQAQKLPAGQQDQGHGVVLHDQGDGHQQKKLFEVGVAYKRCPKSKFSIWIIVFDELELIIFVSQGLTLSTASLVLSSFFSSLVKFQAQVSILRTLLYLL